nr:ribonuclease H-like domain-containing protein [Tanacetum cinerariifolium]
VPQTTCRSSVVHPRDQNDPHDDAHPEGENNAKQQNTSEYEAYVSGESSSGQDNKKEQGPSTLGNQVQVDDYDFWTESYASDDDEIPTKQVSQDIMEEVSLTIDEAKLKKIADEMLRQRCTWRDEHQYHIDQMKNFLKSDIVWESRKEILVSPHPQITTPLVQSCQRDPEAPALSLINQDLLYLKKGSSGPKKIVLSLHKFPAVIFNDDDIEERTFRWVNKCVKKFNHYARYGFEHWKNPHAKIFYIRIQKEHEKPKEIVARRANECIVSITEPDFKNLNKNDIEEMYLLIMNGKVPDYAETGLLWSLSVFIRKKHEMFSIIYEPVHGIIYKNRKKEKMMMWHSEIHKFCDATLNRVLEDEKMWDVCEWKTTWTTKRTPRIIDPEGEIVSQQQGIDCDETFSLVVKPATIRTVLSLSVSREWPIHQLDVKNTFLHGHLTGTVYMHQPPGFTDLAHSDYVCLLQKSLYGFKQPPPLAMLFEPVSIIAKLTQLAMIDLGPLNYFLSIFATRTTSGIFLSQTKYATEILEQAQMLNCNPCKTPIDTEKKLGSEGSQLCLYMHDPREPHLNAMKRVLRYLRGTTDLGLQLFRSTTSQLIAYSDANWAGCPATRRSNSGYCVFLGDNLLMWSSKRQDTLSRSSVEAEYRVVANVVAETSWIRNLLRKLHTLLFTATLVYCDNVSVVYMFANPVQHHHTKHIEIDIHFVRDKVAPGHVRVLHVPSRFQYAYIFTKGLPYPLFANFRSSLSEYQMVCTRLDIASADVGMLDKFDRRLQTDVQVFVNFNYTMGRSITVMGRSITRLQMSLLAKGTRNRVRIRAKDSSGYCYRCLVKGYPWSEVPA